MLRVGLTGSVAVGKSFVCEVLRESGCFVLDADSTARNVVARKSIGLSRIIENFGEEILLEDGTLNRTKMGEIIFADEAKRRVLNSIVHPLVFEAQDRWLKYIEQEHADAIAIIDAALMIESGGYKRFEKIIVVWCEPEIQIERLVRRNNLSREEALLRINAQIPQEEKKKFADFLIDTSAGFESARRQTIEVFEKLKNLQK